jgi:hypothetical protein
VALVLLGVILLGDSSTPPAPAATTQPAATAPAAAPTTPATAATVSAPAKTPAAAPTAKLPPPRVTTPPADAQAQLQALLASPAPRVVHKSAPVRRRVARPRAASADADNAEPASSQTVKEGRIVDPFAGLK